MSKIVPCLWFDDFQGEEAANYYVTLFENSRVVDVSRYTDADPIPDGTPLMVLFELDGRRYQALNGGPDYKLTEAFSLSVSCADQDEVDRYWSALTADGGEEGPCGWLKDRFGVSWQIVPTRLTELLGDPDEARAKRAMNAMFQMRKIDIAALEKAADEA